MAMARGLESGRQGASQNVAFAAAGGASAASVAFGTQTYQIRVVFVSGTAGAAVRIVVGDGTPVATATSTLLPAGWIEMLTVSPGQKIAVLSNDVGTGSLNVTEMTG